MDGAELERQAGLPVAESRTPGLVQTVSQAFSPLPALEAAPASAPVKVDPASLGVVTSAVSVLVMDRASGEVLFEKNPHEIRSIGSITKLMTAYVAHQSGLDLSEPASVTAEDIRYGGINYLAIDDVVSVGDILEASLVGSDNSATAALVRLSGFETESFVALMNQTAAELGLKNTNFVDPTGLGSENRSTAHEITVLLDQVLSDEVIRAIVKEPEAIFSSSSGRDYKVPNTNELLTSYLNLDPFQIIGSKTGYLPEAGYCLAMVIQENFGHDIFVVVLGSSTKESRFQEAKGLTEWAYDTYDWSDQI